MGNDVRVTSKEGEQRKLTKSGDDKKTKDFSRPTRELSDDTPQKSDESRKRKREPLGEVTENRDAKKSRVDDLIKPNQRGKENTSEQSKRGLGEKAGAELGEKAGKVAGAELGEKAGKKAGKVVGREAGAVIGGVVGSMVGPEGTVIGKRLGAKLGKELGEKYGEELGKEAGKKAGKVVGREAGAVIGRTLLDGAFKEKKGVGDLMKTNSNDLPPAYSKELPTGHDTPPDYAPGKKPSISDLMRDTTQLLEANAAKPGGVGDLMKTNSNDLPPAYSKELPKGHQGGLEFGK